MLAPPDPDEQDALRAFNRSPHPYTHRSPERFSVHQVGETAAGSDSLLSPTIFPPFSKESTPGTDSGTEADDEHFLKGLPAPKTRLHKGLRGRSEPISEAPSPIPSPAILEPGHVEAISQRLIPEATQRRTRKLGPLQRNKVLVRRSTELALLMVLGYTVYTNEHVSLLVTYWKKGMTGSSFECMKCKSYLTCIRFAGCGHIVRRLAGSISPSCRRFRIPEEATKTANSSATTLRFRSRTAALSTLNNLVRFSSPCA